MNAYTLPTVPAICRRNIFSVKVVVLTSPRDGNLCKGILCVNHFVRQALLGNWRGALIDRWSNVNEAVYLIRATRERIFSLLNTIYWITYWLAYLLTEYLLISCRNQPFPQVTAAASGFCKILKKSCEVYCSLTDDSCANQNKKWCVILAYINRKMFAKMKRKRKKNGLWIYLGPTLIKQNRNNGPTNSQTDKKNYTRCSRDWHLSERLEPP